MEDLGSGTVVGALTARFAHARQRTTWRSALVALAVVALLGLAGERALAWQQERSRLHDGAAAVAAATTEVDRLIGVSSATSADDLRDLVDGATASFRDELQSQAGALTKALRTHHVTATGKVVSAGVVKLADGNATVIVAAAGSVRNTQTRRAQPRNYRLRVDLQDVADRWLISGLEFVS